MRVLLLFILLAPPLFAVDLKDIDRDTLRYTRLALLKDEVRAHFGLRVGDFESLHQALAVNLDGKRLLLLRLETKAAAVVIQSEKNADTAGAHLFFEVESRIEAAALLDDSFTAINCATATDGPQRTRLLRLRDGKLQLCFDWISAEQLRLEGSRYEVRTTRALAAGPELVEQTEYLLDAKRMDGGLATRTTRLQDNAERLSPGAETIVPVSVTQHCTIARKLERDALNEAALHHARAALAQAQVDKLPEGDARRLEAQSLVARLEARLRPPVQVAKSASK